MAFRRIITFCFCWSLLLTARAQIEPCAMEEVQHRLMEIDPDYGSEVKHYIEETLPGIANTAAERTVVAVVTIPVVVHVIHTGQSIGNGANISQTRIESQVELLNEDYRRANADANETPDEFANVAADTEIQFCLAMVDANGGLTNGITRHVYSDVPDIDYIESVIKPATTWDPDRYLNIWTIDMPSNSVLGYSYLPTNTIVGTDKDGVVVDYPKFGYVDAGNRGRTCTHEVGHYLGLMHTWGANDSDGDPIGCASDDGISDTPNCNGPHYGCPTFGLTSCGNVDMVMNFMEYVNDDCMNLFTTGQKNIMQTTLNGIRSELVANALTACEEMELSCYDLADGDLEMGFEATESTSGWVIENANNDNRTWLLTQTATNDWGPNTGEGLAVYLWNTNGNTSGDDYLFTPCIEVKANHSYKLSFSYACAADGGDVFVEAFEVGFSDQQTSGDFVVPNNDDWTFGNVSNAYPNYNDESLTFSVNSDDVYSLGFHVFSAPDRYAMQIDDIKLEDLGLTSATPIAIGEPGVNKIKISPNPTNDLLNIDLKVAQQGEALSIEIYDVPGQIVERIDLNQVPNRHQIDLSNYENGLYFIKVEFGTFLYTEKVIKVE